MVHVFFHNSIFKKTIELWKDTRTIQKRDRMQAVEGGSPTMGLLNMNGWIEAH